MTKLSKIYYQIALNPKDVKFEDLDKLLRARRLTNNSIANKCSKWLDFKIS